MFFHWSLNDNKSPQVSSILLSILADLNNAVIWMVWICLLIFNFSSFFSKSLGTFPSTPITNGITITLMFYIMNINIIIIILSLANFTYQLWWFFFSWSLNDCKSPQVTFLVSWSILDVQGIWLILILPLI